MSAWLKSSSLRINLDKVFYIKKVLLAGGVKLDFQGASNTSAMLGIINPTAADVLLDLVIQTISSGADITIDAAPYEKL